MMRQDTGLDVHLMSGFVSAFIISLMYLSGGSDIGSQFTLLIGIVIGSVLPDIDIKRSKLRKKIAFVAFISMVMSIALIAENTIGYGDNYRMLFDSLMGGAFLTSLIHMRIPHRGITHGLVGMILITAAFGSLLYLWSHDVKGYYGVLIGINVHLFIDLLGSGRVGTLYNIKFRGVVSLLLMAASAVMMTIGIEEYNKMFEMGFDAMSGLVSSATVALGI